MNNLLTHGGGRRRIRFERLFGFIWIYHYYSLPLYPPPHHAGPAVILLYAPDAAAFVAADTGEERANDRRTRALRRFRTTEQMAIHRRIILYIYIVNQHYIILLYRVVVCGESHDVCCTRHDSAMQIRRKRHSVLRGGSYLGRVCVWFLAFVNGTTTTTSICYRRGIRGVIVIIMLTFFRILRNTSHSHNGMQILILMASR